MEVIKIEGTATVEGNRITIRDNEGKPYNVLNKTKIENKDFIDQIPKGQKTFKVSFTAQKTNINVSSLEVVKPEVRSLDAVLKNIPQKRKDGEKFSETTDLASSNSNCETPVKIPSQIPPNAKVVTIKDILERANEGVEKKIEEINRTVKEKGFVLCGACGKTEHSKEAPMSFNTWYYLDELSPGKDGPSVRAERRLFELQAVLNEVGYCECDLKAVPCSLYNVFRRVSPQEKTAIDNAYEGKYAKNLRSDVFPEMVESVSEISQSISKKAEVKQPKAVMFEVLDIIDDKQRINHIVPRSAGGCPTKTFDIVAEFKGEKLAPSNLIPIWNMCKLCQLLDELFTKWQNEQKHETIDSYIRNVLQK